MTPADLACLPARLPLDLLVRGLMKLRPSTRRRIIDDHRLVCRGRDRTLWRGERLSEGACLDVLAGVNR